MVFYLLNAVKIQTELTKLLVKQAKCQERNSNFQYAFLQIEYAHADRAQTGREICGEKHDTAKERGCAPSVWLQVTCMTSAASRL
jgi:hypothetical protein